jgi:hypothetical protein
MEENLNKVEDQPQPSGDDGLAAASAEFQQAVDGLSAKLLLKFQMNGMQFNALELEVRVLVLTEQLNVLTKIIQGVTGGYSDAQLTRQMVGQVNQLTKTLTEALAAAPRIAIPAGGAPPKLNGSRHN